MSDMKHMGFIQQVADADVRVLREKEATYQGSWKRAGGRSAWFMFRRNMDRLIEMLKKPPTPHAFGMADLDDCIAQAGASPTGDCTMDWTIVQYLRDCYVSENIFAGIRGAPGGEDGTVLACLRDLRRYAVLIEAEMMARGVVFVDLSADEAVEDIASDHPLYPLFAGSVKNVPGTPEDGGQHARQVVEDTVNWSSSSFVIGYESYKLLGETIGSLMYDEWAPRKTYLLTPHLSHSKMFSLSKEPGHEVRMALYDHVGLGGYVLRVRDAPATHRSLWPVLLAEYNSHEFEKIPRWCRDLYRREEAASKWVIEQQYEAWTRG